MGSLSDTYGGSQSRGRSASGSDDPGPLVRPSSPATPEENGVDVGATLTLLGGALGVLGVGIAFFSSTLPAALGYTLLVALGAGTVAYRYTGTSVAVAAPALAGSGRRSRRGRTRSRAWRASRSSGLGRRRTRLSSLRAAAGRLVSRVAGPGRDRDDRL